MLSGLGDIGLNIVFLLLLLLLCLLVFSMFVDSFYLGLLLFLVFVWFSLWFLILSNLHMMHPEGSELDAALYNM